MFYREHKINIILWSVFCSWQWNIHYSCFWPFCPEGGERGGLCGYKGTGRLQYRSSDHSRHLIENFKSVYFDQGFSLPKIFFWQPLRNQALGSKCDLWYYEDILVSLKQQSFFLALINLSPQATPGNWKETEMCDVGIFQTFDDSFISSKISRNFWEISFLSSIHLSLYFSSWLSDLNVGIMVYS